MDRACSLKSLMSTCKELYSDDILCELSPEDSAEYKRLLERFHTVNNSVCKTTEKGKALEDLVGFLIEKSGNIFEVVKNVKTGTNEIDEVITLNETGKMLVGFKLLPERFEFVLGECKNYHTKVGVTYVGKFYSLLQTTAITTGILFSYHGVTGKNWNDGSGLIKKIYLQREDPDKRVAIIDFSYEDFKRIADGDNFLSIIRKKLEALQLDTSIATSIAKHPAEKYFEKT